MPLSAGFGGGAMRASLEPGTCAYPSEMCLSMWGGVCSAACLGGQLFTWRIWARGCAGTVQRVMMFVVRLGVYVLQQELFILPVGN